MTWNSNTHYHGFIIASLPLEASRVLDVGCGDGLLCADLIRAGVTHVVGLDCDAPVLHRARARFPDLAIEWLNADVFSAPVPAASFDAVVSVATLHHLDAARALERFAQLVRPGGRVIVIGLAGNDWWDYPYTAVAIAARELLTLVRGRWEHTAPMCWPPPLTYAQMRDLAARVLPGMTYRRHLLGRYSLVWTRPA